MRKLVLLLCCISVLSLLGGCKADKEEMDYNITDIEATPLKEADYLKYLAGKSEESLSSIAGVESVNIDVLDNEGQGYSVQVSITTSGSLSDMSLSQIKVYLENTFVNAMLFVDGAEVSLGGITGIDYNTETEYIYDDINNDSNKEYSKIEYAAVEYPALIRVKGRLYYDSAEISTEKRCGVMDGSIDSVCVGNIPSEDNQSNFGKGYSYQYGVDTIEVLIDDEWHIFKKFDYNEWDILPEYIYPGDDPIEKAITEYFISNNYHYEMKSSVVIPAFCIFMSEVDENDADVGKVYGNYWLFGYEKNDTTLECVSGGENPGVIYLRKDGNSYVVDHFDKPGEGAKYVEDIISLCNGNQTLAEHYYNSSNAIAEPVKSKRDWTIKKYVEMYDLDIDSYHDYGCDKVMLSDYHSDEGIEE